MLVLEDWGTGEGGGWVGELGGRGWGTRDLTVPSAYCNLSAKPIKIKIKMHINTLKTTIKDINSLNN